MGCEIAGYRWGCDCSSHRTNDGGGTIRSRRGSTVRWCALIPKEHYEYWESFVIDCRLLSLPVLTDLVIKKADLLLVHFCRKVELLA